MGNIIYKTGSNTVRTSELWNRNTTFRLMFKNMINSNFLQQKQIHIYLEVILKVTSQTFYIVITSLLFIVITVIIFNIFYLLFKSILSLDPNLEKFFYLFNFRTSSKQIYHTANSAVSNVSIKKLIVQSAKYQ